MAATTASLVIRHLRSAVLQPEGAALTDGQLLRHYIESRDQTAFEGLVRRHGRMVHGVCRRILSHAHDAEDAFQATFMVLARKAASVVPGEAVGNWLYGVAYHTALKAQAAASRRRAKERQVEVMPEPQAGPQDPLHDVLPLLDRELSRLPEKYRLPAVLCDLQGRPRREVAQQLGIPEGTLSSRLTTARRLLARRLRQHGATLAGGAVAAALAQHATAGCLPGSLVSSTVKAATQFAAGEAIASARAATLAEGVLKIMFLNKLRLATTLMLAVCCLAAVAGWPAYRILAAVAGAEDPAQQVRAPDDARATLAVVKEQDDGEQSIRGSGKIVTKEIDLKDFTLVEVSSVFRVEISKAAAFRTTIEADDNLLPLIKVTKEGMALRVALDTTNKSISSTMLKATIAMPVLEGVKASGASQVHLGGFKSAKTFKANVAHASKLAGDVEAARVDLVVEGASTVTLKGSAKDGRISAAHACSLKLGEFALDRVDVTLKGACSASVNVKEKLDYDLADASHLEYRGDPTIGKHRTSGASRASRASGQRGKVEGEQSLTFPHSPTALRDHLDAMHEHLRQVHAGFDHLRELHPAGRISPAGGQSGQLAPSAPMRVSVGDKVPDFAIINLVGKSLRLSELQKDARQTKTGVVVLSFWCSFCPSCRRVEHALDKLAKDYQGQALVVALDASAGETAEAARATAKKESLTLPIVLDPPGHTADVFGTEATTTTVVIDGQGVLRYCGRFNDGPRSYAEDALKAVLAGTEVAIKTTRHDGCRIVRK
jgi:RNA polymerase sigma factor (sigma-70 family)